LEKAILKTLDYFFIIFHSSFSAFNLTGWAFRKTRKYHLATMSATFFSWFILGIFYGWGYCFCTHWHWLVRNKLNRPIHSSSYIQFLIIELTGITLPQNQVDITVIILFSACLLLSVYLNIMDYRKKKQ